MEHFIGVFALFVCYWLFTCVFAHSHHMVEALEERASREIVDHDTVIKGLQKERNGLIMEKK